MLSWLLLWRLPTPELCVAEQLVGEKCTEKADIYSLGIVLWELCTLDTPLLRQTRDILYATCCLPLPAASDLRPELHKSNLWCTSSAIFADAVCLDAWTWYMQHW